MTNCNALRPGWTPLTIGLMVLGFIVFWPLGLAMLAYILWGDQFQHMFKDARSHLEKVVQDTAPSRPKNWARPANTGNVAFDDFRQREIDRLEEQRRRLDEERKKLDAMEEEFDEFLRNLRRAKDQEEFNRFMQSRDSTSGNDTPEGGEAKPAY